MPWVSQSMSLWAKCSGTEKGGRTHQSANSGGGYRPAFCPYLLHHNMHMGRGSGQTCTYSWQNMMCDRGINTDTDTHTHRHTHRLHCTWDSLPRDEASKEWHSFSRLQLWRTDKMGYLGWMLSTSHLTDLLNVWHTPHTRVHSYLPALPPCLTRPPLYTNRPFRQTELFQVQSMIKLLRGAGK